MAVAYADPVSGGGVPVEAFYSQGQLVEQRSPGALAGHQIATWALSAPTVVQGGPCEAYVADGEEPCHLTGWKQTRLCYNHWKVVANSFARGTSALAGHDPRSDRQKRAESKERTARKAAAARRAANRKAAAARKAAEQ